jgi:putative amidase-like protein
VTALVDMTTTLKLADDGLGNPPEASWSDPHRITLKKVHHRYVPVSDTVVAPEAADSVGSESAAAPGGTPYRAPRLSSVVRPTHRTASTSAGTAAASGGSVSAMAYAVQPRISPTKFSAYALKWTSFPYAGDTAAYFNPDYPYVENNCANFASQVLDYAGWNVTPATSGQIWDDTKWHYNVSGIAGPTRTWTLARDLYTFASNTGSYTDLGSIWQATTGDLLFVDWTKGDKLDTQIDHVMVVSGVQADGTPRISQKNSNRNNISLSTSVALAKDQGFKYIQWYGLKHK